MPFERYPFTSCLLPDTFRFKEEGAYVHIIPEDGETVLFFCIDDQSKGHSVCSGSKMRE